MYSYPSTVCLMYSYPSTVCFMYSYPNTVCFMYSYPSTVCLMSKRCVLQAVVGEGVSVSVHIHITLCSPWSVCVLSNRLWSLPLGTTADEWPLLYKWHSSKNNCPIRTHNKSWHESVLQRSDSFQSVLLDVLLNSQTLSTDTSICSAKWSDPIHGYFHMFC